MTPAPERFKHFLIIRDSGGQPVYLSRAPDEAVFPAFDERAGRLVELHVLPWSATLDAAEKRSVLERAALAAELQGWTFMQVLEAGEDDALIYYSSTLNDGERSEEYVARRGALPPVAALCLTLQLLEDLVELQSYHRLIPHLRLSSLLVTVVEGLYLHLRVFDFGFSEKEKRCDGDLKRLSAETCELIFLLLTGRPFGGEDPEHVPELTAVPTRLRSMLQTVLADNTHAPETPDALRDAVDEALAALVYQFEIDDARKHLLITDENPPPRLPLEDLSFTPGETPTPDSEMPVVETHSAIQETRDHLSPARHGLRGPVIWSALTIGVICILIWLFVGQSGTVPPSPEPEAAVVSMPDKPKITQPQEAEPKRPAAEAPVIVRKAIIPSADEIEEFRRRQAVGAKGEPQAPATKRGGPTNPTANR